jgi:amidohydrolase
MTIDIKSIVQAVVPQMLYTRREIHAHPELSFQEHRTSQLIAETMRSLGIDVTDGIAGTGVVGLITGAHSGPTLMIRADIDALPIHEASKSTYSSQNSGIMHACGHDGHTAVVLAVAKILSEQRSRIGGHIKLVFQPAEETMEGATRMLTDRVMDNPQVDRVLGFHLWNPLEVGQIGIRTGPIFASADEFRLIVHGKGGHGALPHQAIDPIIISAHLISALQTLISRESPPSKPAVLTIGTIHGGSAYNVIADSVEMTGTLRTFDEDLRQTLLRRIHEVAAGITSSLQGSFEFELIRGCPPVDNDPNVVAFVSNVASSLVGNENVITVEPATTGDDISFFLNEAPGCYFLVGSSNSSRGLDASHHSPNFDFDEQALSIATELLISCVFEYMT